jgi:hypothetical protein
MGINGSYAVKFCDEILIWAVSPGFQVKPEGKIELYPEIVPERNYLATKN